MKSPFLIVFVLAVILILGYCQVTKEPASPKSELETSDQSESDPRLKKIKLVQNQPKANPPPPSQNSAQSSSPGFLPTSMESPQKFEVLQKSIQQLAGCLNMEVKPLNAADQFDFGSLYSSIGSDLGDVVMKLEEWSATDIRTPEGEIRRLYLEAPSEKSRARKLRYISMNRNGAQKDISLTNEQSTNPTDTLLASLEADGQVVSKSRSERIYFENGDSLLVVEKNGSIYSFQLPHDGKTFSCTGADQATSMQCQCR